MECGPLRFIGLVLHHLYGALVRCVKILWQQHRPIIQINTPLVTADNVEEMKATFIDGQPEYDFTDLSYCVMADYETFEELAASSAE